MLRASLSVMTSASDLIPAWTTATQHFHKCIHFESQCPAFPRWKHENIQIKSWNTFSLYHFHYTLSMCLFLLWNLTQTNYSINCLEHYKKWMKIKLMNEYVLRLTAPIEVFHFIWFARDILIVATFKLYFFSWRHSRYIKRALDIYRYTTNNCLILMW